MTSTRNVDPAVAAARARYANVVRNNGSPEAITAAKDALRIAKSERLRRDADALLAGLSTTQVRVINNTDEPISRENHDALLATQLKEADRFKQAYPSPRTWDEETRAAWSDLLARHKEAHVALGCSEIAMCRQ